MGTQKEKRTMPGRNGGTLRVGGDGSGGRPRKLPAINDLIADVLSEEKDGLTAAEAILKKLRQMAASGNLKAAEMLLDRAYGKPKSSTDITTNGKEIMRGPLADLPIEDQADILRKLIKADADT